jgi:hypothetical protein
MGANFYKQFQKKTRHSKQKEFSMRYCAAKLQGHEEVRTGTRKSSMHYI